MQQKFLSWNILSESCVLSLAGTKELKIIFCADGSSHVNKTEERCFGLQVFTLLVTNKFNKLVRKQSNLDLVSQEKSLLTSTRDAKGKA